MYGIGKHYKENKVFGLKTGAVSEELKQRTVAIAEKVRRYSEGADRFRQNRMFQNNRDSVIGNSIRKEKGNTGFGNTYGVSGWVIIEMRNSSKTCRVKSML